VTAWLEHLKAAWGLDDLDLAVGSIVFFNLVPLVGVVLLGWDLIPMLGLYWAEAGIVGAITVIEIFLANGSEVEPGSVVFVAVPPVAVQADHPVSLVSRLVTASLFLFSYGIFWAWYGLFAFVFVPAMAGNPPDTVADLVILDPLIFGVLALGLAISHTVKFWDDFVRSGDYRRLSPTQVVSPAYDQSFALFWVVVFCGASVTTLLGTPVGAVIALVVFKIWLDIYFYGRDHPELFDDPVRPSKVRLSKPGWSRRANSPPLASRSMTRRWWDGMTWFPLSVGRGLSRRARRERANR